MIIFQRFFEKTIAFVLKIMYNMVTSGVKCNEMEEKGGKMMLSGTYVHNVDAKGRIIMPARLREDLGEGCVISKGYEGCLCIYSKDEWAKFMEGLVAKMPEEKAKARKLVRLFSAGAMDCDVDKQGRVLIPPILREGAGIEKEVTIIGNVNKVEIWDSARWAAYNSEDDSLEDLAEELFELGY